MALLYLEDLYDFYTNKYKRSTRFSAEKTGEPIVVQTLGKLNFTKDEYDDNEGLIAVKLQACHTLENSNGSYISAETMENALPSFKNRPILGYIHKVVTDECPEGRWEFEGHKMHEENDQLVYDERPVGVIPETCDAKLVYDEEKDKTYCEVNGYIYEEYSHAAEILEREQECNVSIEIGIRELSYDAKNKRLNIENFFFRGVTILGIRENGDKVNPGMTGANIKLADFNLKNNSLFSDYNSALVEIQDRLNKLESACFDINDNAKEGGHPLVENETILEGVAEVMEEKVFTEEEENTDEVTSADDEENASEGSENEVEEQTFEKVVRTYEISHEDIRMALYSLLEEFERAENEYYYIASVYDNYFVYENWDGNKIFGQKYVKDENNVAFDGERYNLHVEYLTDSEYTELQNMRSNYSVLKDFKDNAERNELHVQREAILNSDKFALISENDSFKELVKNMDNYSVEELEKEAKVIFADCVSTQTFANENKTFIFGNPDKVKKNNRYGNLFSK